MTRPDALPDGTLVAFYGDDFTGSSAVMEVLSFAGLPTVLFIEPPTAEDLARFAGYRAIGIAGVARSRSPEWMDEELPPIFASLTALGAPVTHYKTCSTLDSSPRIGSIGRAMDLAVAALEAREGAADWVPLVVGAPAIGRYQAFGNLFAAYAGGNYRLDRHPVMRRHPATPMDEADVAAHVGRQTSRAIGLVDMAAIKSGTGEDSLDAEIAAGRRVVSLDVLDGETLRWAGRQIWARRAGGVLAVGSQGVEYALTAYWREAGLIEPDFEVPAADATAQILSASGSVSPVTAAQIEWAGNNGFAVIPVDAALAVSDGPWQAELARVVDAAKAPLSSGRSILLASAQGPDDPAVARMREAIDSSGADPEAVNGRIGEGLGAAIMELVQLSGLRRVALAGGDSSGYAARRLGIRALTALAPLAGGAPLCRAFSSTPDTDGLEIVLKGGQMGGVDFFGRVRAGRAIDEKEKLN